MKTPLKLFCSFATILLLSNIAAYAYYDPTVGRWASRDPIGELGANNLYVAFGNNPVNEVDYLGLHTTGVEYHSEGRAERDPWYLTDWTESESGISDTPYAWYEQTVRGALCNRGGICNTGDNGVHLGSFVKATVKNLYPCCMVFRIRCKYDFEAFGRSTYRSFATAKLVGTMLDQPVQGFRASTYNHEAQGTLLVLAKSETREKIVRIQSESTYLLYDIYPSVAGFRGVPSSFREKNKAVCSVVPIAPCSR
jgi:hypothetical protein